MKSNTLNGLLFELYPLNLLTHTMPAIKFTYINMFSID